MKKMMLNRLLIFIFLCISSNMHGFLPCLSGPFASNTAVNDCLNASVSGNLNLLITGGSGPFTFGPASAPVGGSVLIGPTSGIFLFTPTNNFSGGAGFSFQVTDSNACSATATVGITIASPIITNESFTDCNSTGVTGNLSNFVTSGFPPYIFILSGSPVGGIASVSASGVFSFTPTAGFNGQGGFVFQVVDSNNCLGTGAINVAIGSPITATAIISTCNNSLTGNLNNFATGGTQPLFFDGPVGPISCTGGSVTVNVDGTFSFTAPTGFTGPCSFVYEVSDSNECSNTGSVTITANNVPVAQNASYSTCKNDPVNQTLQVVGGVAPYTFSIVSPVLHGTITSFNASTGAFTYTPNVGFVGNDSFQFQVIDSSVPPCTSNIATIMLVVNDCCTPITDPFFQMVVSEFNDQIPV